VYVLNTMWHHPFRIYPIGGATVRPIYHSYSDLTALV